MEKLIEEVFYKVLPVLLLALIGGAFKLRDMILDNRRRVIENREHIDTLEQKRASDLVEYNSLLAMARSIDSKIDQKLAIYFKEASEQRHKDNDELKSTLHNLDKTLTKLDGKLEFLTEDVKTLKSKSKD